MIDSQLLSILCCPESGQSLSLADDSIVKKLNAAVEAGTLQNRAGELITESCEEFLITADQKRVYPVKSGIPVLLADESILLQ